MLLQDIDELAVPTQRPVNSNSLARNLSSNALF
jgi:hypothetical protein